MHRPLLPSLACLIALMAGCGGGGSSSEAPPPAAPTPVAYAYAGSVERDRRIASSNTGISYPYHVYLPEGYAASGKTYPVIYATDGQWTFNAFSQMIDRRRTPAILVNIEQGGPDRRAVDYTVNGAPAYARFLREELVPLIERSYRTTPVRTYVGTSYGGLLGALMLSKEDVAAPFFRNYLLFDGSFWALTSKDIEDEEARFVASPRLPVRLLLTTATPGNQRDVVAFEARYLARGYTDLVIQRKDFNVTHNDVGDPSFDWALDQIDWGRP